MKSVIELLHLCPQLGKVIFCDCGFAQGLEFFFHGFNSLEMR